MLWALTDGDRRLAQPKARGLCPVCSGEVIAKCGKIVSWHWAHKKCDCDPWYEPESEWHIQWKQQFPKEWQEVAIGNHRADVKTPNGVVELQNSSLTAAEIQAREDFYGKMLWVVNAQKFKDKLFEITPLSWETEYVREKKKPKWELFPPPAPSSERFDDKWGLFELLGIDKLTDKDQQEYEKDKRQYEARHQRWVNRYSHMIQAYDNWIEQKRRHSAHFAWKWPRKTWLIATKKVYLDFGQDRLFLVTGNYVSQGQVVVKTRPISKEFFIKKLLSA